MSMTALNCNCNASYHPELRKEYKKMNQNPLLSYIVCRCGSIYELGPHVAEFTTVFHPETRIVTRVQFHVIKLLLSMTRGEKFYSKISPDC